LSKLKKVLILGLTHESRNNEPLQAQRTEMRVWGIFCVSPDITAISNHIRYILVVCQDKNDGLWCERLAHAGKIPALPKTGQNKFDRLLVIESSW